MSYKNQLALFITAVIFIMVMVTILQSSGKRQVTNGELMVTAWVPGWQQAEALTSLNQHYSQIDELVILQYSVLPDGQVVPFTNAASDIALKAKAQSLQIPLLAAVANLNPAAGNQEWSSEVVESVIMDTNTRSRHINHLSDLARDYDGIVIDYESLSPSLGTGFVDFLSSLSDRLKPEQKKLAVVVPPVQAPPFNWQALRQVADEVHIMSYEQHWAASTPGPVAALDWYEDVSANAARALGAEAAVMGLPLYGYDWGANALAEGLTFNRVQSLLENTGATPLWHDKFASPYFSYQSENEHTVWFENARSTNAKIDAIKDQGLNRVFLWFLGGEDPAVWPHLV